MVAKIGRGRNLQKKSQTTEKNMISTKKMWDKIMNKNWVMQKFIWGGVENRKKNPKFLKMLVLKKWAKMMKKMGVAKIAKKNLISCKKWGGRGQKLGWGQNRKNDFFPKS